MKKSEWNVFAAAGTGRIDILKKLRERGSDINARQAGKTALYHAIIHNELNCIKYILEHGGCVHDKVDGEHSAVYLATRYRSLAALRILFEHGANGACFDSGEAVYMAVQNSDHEIIRILLQHGAHFDKGFRSALDTHRWDLIEVFSSTCAPLDRCWFAEWGLHKMSADNKTTIDIAHHLVEHSGDLSGLPDCMKRIAVCLQSNDYQWLKHRDSLWWLVRKAIDKGATHRELVPKNTWFQFFWNSQYETLADIARTQNETHMVDFLNQLG